MAANESLGPPVSWTQTSTLVQTAFALIRSWILFRFFCLSVSFRSPKAQQRPRSQLDLARFLGRRPAPQRGSRATSSPSALSHPLGEGSPTEIDYRKKGTLVLSWTSSFFFNFYVPGAGQTKQVPFKPMKVPETNKIPLKPGDNSQFHFPVAVQTKKVPFIRGKLQTQTDPFTTRDNSQRHSPAGQTDSSLAQKQPLLTYSGNWDPLGSGYEHLP